MGKPTFHADAMDGAAGLVKLQFEKNSNQQAGLQEVIAAFDDFLADGRRNFIFDLQNVPFPSTSFIAFLITATMRARRAHGDVKLVNVADSAKNNLVTFSPLTYLSVEDHETEAQPHLVMDTQGNGGAQNKLVDIADSPAVASLPADPPGQPRQSNIATRMESDCEHSHHLKVESVAANLYRLCDFVAAHAHQAGMEEKEIGKTKIAVYEACLNVIEHAYHSNPNYWIDLWVNYTREQFTIIIQDHGLPFEMPESKPYDVQDAMEKRRTGGFGLHIIRRSMDDIDYKADANIGNRLTMIKKLR